MDIGTQEVGYASTETIWAIAEELHGDQTMGSGKRYFGHPIRVSEIGRDLARKALKANPNFFSGYTGDPIEKVAQVCLIHDIFEDQGHKINSQQLLDKGVDPDVVEAALLLTKKPGEKYTDAVERAKGNPFSRLGKMSDLTHNSKLTRTKASNEPVTDTIARHTKYLLSYMYLSDRIDKKTYLETMEPIISPLKMHQ